MVRIGLLFPLKRHINILRGFLEEKQKKNKLVCNNGDSNHWPQRTIDKVLRSDYHLHISTNPRGTVPVRAVLGSLSAYNWIVKYLTNSVFYVPFSLRSIETQNLWALFSIELHLAIVHGVGWAVDCSFAVWTPNFWLKNIISMLEGDPPMIFFPLYLPKFKRYLERSS